MTIQTAIDNSRDIIDSRDVIDRIATLEEEQDDALENNTIDAWEDEGWGQELDTLRSLADEASDYAADWEYGETLIRDSYFETYAQELAHDIGYLTGDETWPHTCVDWARAADELKVDYTAVEFDGADYWIRS